MRPGYGALNENPAHGANPRSGTGRRGVHKMLYSRKFCNRNYDFPRLSTSANQGHTASLGSVNSFIVVIVPQYMNAEL